MTILSNSERLERRAETRELAAALVEDLAYYREVLDRPEQSPAELRRLSGSLRRVLLDGDIAIAASPRTGKLTLRLPDNRPIYDWVNERNTRTFLSLGMPAFGLVVRAVCDMAGPHPAINLDAVGYGRLDGFLSQRVVFHAGRWITRRAVLKYIAYIKHGVHSGMPVTKGVEDTHVLNRVRHHMHMSIRNGHPAIAFNPSPPEPFDPEQFNYAPAAVDCVLLEMLAAVEYVVKSEHVIELEAVIRDELGAK